nr:STM3941 family protein [uncultured Draconibacterium sp.]
METEKNDIRIGISKTKAVLLTIFIAGLFSLTIWAWIKVLTMDSGFDKNFLMTGLSLMSTTFGLLTLSALKKLSDNSQGLIINDKGIKINIGPNRGQFIKWTEIEKIKIHSQTGGNIYLLIFVKNPAEILLKAQGLNRFLLKMNNKSHKTPVSITSTWLEKNQIEIMELIDEKMKKTVHNKIQII